MPSSESPSTSSRAVRSDAVSRVGARLWVQCGGETYLGEGRVCLLERIGQSGSIAGAARSMGMSYRHAWDLVEQMNRLAPVPLVERMTGGRGGGGTHLTGAGRQAIAQFRSAVAAVHALLLALDPPGRDLRPPDAERVA